MIDGVPILISIDWKSQGRDYLDFFPDRYSDLTFWEGDDFGALLDDIAMVDVENAFEALSGFLALHGYELWNLDTGGDTYELFLLPTKGRAKAKTSLVKDLAENGLTFPMDRLGVGAAQRALSAKATTKPKAAPKASIIDDSEYHGSYGSLGYATSPIQVMTFLDEDTDGEVHNLVNLDTWPIDDVEQSAGFWTDSRLWSVDHSKSAMLLYGTQKQTFWESEVGDEMYQLLVVTDYEKPTVETWPGCGPYDYRARGVWAGVADALFIYFGQETDVPPKSGFLSKIKGAFGLGGKADVQQGLFVAQGGTIRKVVDLPSNPTHILPINGDKVLVFFGDFHAQSRSFGIVDVKTGVLSEITEYPRNDMSSPFLISQTEFGFIEVEEGPHPTHPNLFNSTGFLCRYDLTTMTSARAKLDGLLNRTTANMEYRKGQPPNKHVLERFEGTIEALKGHDDWFVLNYHSSHFGPTALTWLWNSANDEIIKITNKDFPREDPSLFYNPVLKRYFAQHLYRLDLLVPFEDIYNSREKTKLVWD